LKYLILGLVGCWGVQPGEALWSSTGGGERQGGGMSVVPGASVTMAVWFGKTAIWVLKVEENTGSFRGKDKSNNKSRAGWKLCCLEDGCMSRAIASDGGVSSGHWGKLELALYFEGEQEGIPCGYLGQRD
jgi:hypothetical protein